MNFRAGEPTTEAERHKATIIHLGDLNGQEGGKGMPKNFHTKRGRCLSSLTRYWSPDEIYEDIEDAFDVE